MGSCHCRRFMPPWRPRVHSDGLHHNHFWHYGMLLPFPVLLQSKIQNRKKIFLLGLFGLGLFITVIQIIRIQTVKKLALYTDSALLILWSAVENNLGIIVTNVPPLAPLVEYFSEKTRTGSNGTSNRHAGYPQEVGSSRHHAMHAWKSGRVNIGHQALGSTNDNTDVDSFEGHVVAKGGSTESILEPGITKKVEVTITRA
ncbi:hypothetical protein B0H63DRAFT_307777 [Podospora didyma]|uniref:Rhodopsin domain-containing protein n=1 Tax=Podospora didyma TaxID=330526 RepID=A0AAE0K573_9PEZI|nr:hypothetical protein B0H63DRAFT_307777 [Podospora didyma]